MISGSSCQQLYSKKPGNSVGWGYEGSFCAAGNLDCEVARAEISAGVEVLTVS